MSLFVLLFLFFGLHMCDQVIVAHIFSSPLCETHDYIRDIACFNQDPMNQVLTKATAF